jgi:hypothetical protein
MRLSGVLVVAWAVPLLSPTESAHDSAVVGGYGTVGYGRRSKPRADRDGGSCLASKTAGSRGRFGRRPTSTWTSRRPRGLSDGLGHVVVAPGGDPCQHALDDERVEQVG